MIAINSLFIVKLFSIKVFLIFELALFVHQKCLILKPVNLVEQGLKFIW